MAEQGRGSAGLGEIAARYGVGTSTVEHLLDALRNGGGGMAQFSAPELGGMGQWSAGGMIMIGDMFNDRLKAKVDALCRELAARIGREDAAPARREPPLGRLEPEPSGAAQASPPGRVAPASHPAGAQPSDSSRAAGSQASGSQASGSQELGSHGAGSGWWPRDLGSPSSTGGQNGVRYAFFPVTRRLLIERDGQRSLYDTGDHLISGVSQAQGGSSSLTFSSQHGPVALESLKAVPLN